MRIIMSIRENRSVITTGVTAVFLSPLDVRFAYLTYMPTRRNVHQISTDIFHSLSMPPGSLPRCIYIDPEPNLSRVIPWVRQSYGRTDKQIQTTTPFGQIRKEVKLGELYIIFLSKMIVILRMLRYWCIFQLQVIWWVVVPSTLWFWFVVSQNSVEWKSNHILVWNSKMNRMILHISGTSDLRLSWDYYRMYSV